MIGSFYPKQTDLSSASSRQTQLASPPSSRTPISLCSSVRRRSLSQWGRGLRLSVSVVLRREGECQSCDQCRCWTMSTLKTVRPLQLLTARWILLTANFTVYPELSNKRLKITAVTSFPWNPAVPRRHHGIRISSSDKCWHFHCSRPIFSSTTIRSETLLVTGSLPSKSPLRLVPGDGF